MVDQTRDRRLDHDFDELLDAMLGPGRAIDGPTRAEAVFSDARERGEPRIELARELIEGLIVDIGREAIPKLTDRVDKWTDLYQRARELRWGRVEAIAESRMLQWRTIAHPETVDETLETLDRLRRELEASPDATALDRVWPDLTEGIVLVECSRFRQALAPSVRAADLAADSGVELVQCETAINLGSIFLIAGDVEAAVAAIEGGLAAADRGGWKIIYLYFNAVMSFALAGRERQALEILETNHWMDLFIDEFGGWLRALWALVLARCGQPDRALEFALAPSNTPARSFSNRNRAWMNGFAFIAAGRPGLARETLEEFLASEDAEELSPLDGTQIYLALSQAREATGDAVGALKALRESQARCHSWVAESVASRLEAIRVSSSRSCRSSDPDGAVARHSELLRQAAELSGAQTGDSDLSYSSYSTSLAPGPAGIGSQSYLSAVTNDMRNSLQGVVAMLSMLQLSNLDDTQRRYADVADASAQTLLALCNDVLDLANLDAGQLVLHPEATDVAEAVREVAMPIAVLCRRVGVDLVVDIDPIFSRPVWLDPLRFRQVLLNLVSNAAKFTTDGHIRVSVRCSPSECTGPCQLRVAVSDTGPGIPDHMLADLFSEFAQADPAHAATGSGLGLAIVDRLVDLMGGSVGVESEVGVGSTFWFELPELPAARAAA